MNKTIGKTLRRFGFTGEILCFRRHILLSVKASLKSEVAGSYLSWIWLILEPIFLTVLYGFFISLFMRGNGLAFGVFILCGLMAMSFFQGGITQSATVIKSKKNLIRNIRIPKHILVCEIMGKNMIKFVISFFLVLLLMLVANVKFTPYLLLLPIPFALLVLMTFSISLFALHVGAYVPDIQKTLKMVFRLLFYASGVIFPIDRVIKHNDQLVDIMVRGNPIAFVMEQFRLLVCDGKSLDFFFCGMWLVIGILISFLGLALIRRHERKYAKID
jgi:ABC-type polysaccharide/polyol phosphate export permease